MHWRLHLHVLSWPSFYVAVVTTSFATSKAESLSALFSKLEQAIRCEIFLKTRDKRLSRPPPDQPGADPNRECRGRSQVSEKEKNVFVCVVGGLAETGEKENTRGCNINSQPVYIYIRNPCAGLSAWHHSCVYRSRT